MQDDDIPVLTNRLQAASEPAPSVSKEMLDEIAAQLKPQLMRDVATELAPKIRHQLNETLIGESANIQKANQAYLSSAIHQLYEQKNHELDDKLKVIQETLQDNIATIMGENLIQLEKQSRVALLEKLDGEIKDIRTNLNQHVDEALDTRVNETVNIVKDSMVAETSALVDKTKADLTTELPALMHSNFEIIQKDMQQNLAEIQDEMVKEVREKVTGSLPELESSMAERVEARLGEVEAASVNTISTRLNEQLEELKSGLYAAHKEEVSTQLLQLNEDLSSQAKLDINQFVDSLKMESEKALQTKLADTFPVLYEGLSSNLINNLEQEIVAKAETVNENFRKQLDVDLPEAEATINNKVNAILDEAKPKIRQEINDFVMSEVKAAISAVRLSFDAD